jgi:hypothetical protein
MGLKVIISFARQEADHERYMQDTIHNWTEDTTFRQRVMRRLYRWPVYHVVSYAWNVHIMATVCRWRGHVYEDSGSWGNPESGGIDLTCRRCGHNIHNVFY